MEVGAVVQARMGSTRLPGKVMMELAGEPMLGRVLERLRRSRSLTGAIVATTESAEDDAICAFCRERGVSYYRGSENDVLDRYYQTALHYGVETVVRITSDCPLIDPDVLDLVVARFMDRAPHVSYVSNSHPRRTFPRGLDVEVLGFHTLAKAWRTARERPEREHVTPFIYMHPEAFGIEGVENETDYSRMRWTVDVWEDFVFIGKIYDHFGNRVFSWVDVLELLRQHPEWIEINAHVEQKAL